jgi:hypothetical protein
MNNEGQHVFLTGQDKNGTDKVKVLKTLVIVHFNYFWNFPVFFWLDSFRASSYIVFHHSDLVQMNFPYPLVILRHWRDLDATLKHNKREKKHLHKV